MRRLLAVLALVAFGAAGCGGDSDDSGGGSSDDAGLDHAALVAEADAICAAGDTEIEDAAAEQFQGQIQPSAQDQEAFVEHTIVPSIQDQLDQLSELEPQAGDVEEFQAIIDDAQSALDDVAADPSLLSVGASGDPFAKANQRARNFGLEKCGDSSR